MASVVSLQRLPHLRATDGSPLRRPTRPLSIKTPNFSSTLCCQGTGLDADSHLSSDRGFGTGRREALAQILLSAASFPSIVKAASAETDVQQELRTYEDEANKFRITVPQDWLVGAGETDGIKSVTAFYPEQSSANVSVAITGIGPDFTRLESFGKVDAFAESLVTGLDRSWQRPPGLAAKLIDAKSANGLYYIEYTLQNPGERRRHLFSAIGMQSNGWYNRLYTVTGQFIEDESDNFRSQIEKSISSFRLTKE